MKSQMIVAVALLALLLSCGGSQADEPKQPNRVMDARFGIMDRFYDEEYGVMCYRYHGASLSCVKVRP
jgi:hypothetical protein